MLLMFMQDYQGRQEPAFPEIRQSFSEEQQVCTNLEL